jgi:hypothetical protein
MAFTHTFTGVVLCHILIEGNRSDEEPIPYHGDIDITVR